VTTWLHRFSIKPGHLDPYLDLWAEERRLRAEAGFAVRRAFLQEHAEPKLTYLYEHADPAADIAYESRPEVVDLRAAAAPHVFRNTLVRPVRVESMAAGTADEAQRIAILRRYSIVGEWSEFLAIWRRIVPVRERYGFRCLVAVADEPAAMFTWAFDFAGTWDEFPAAQRPYYADPERIALRQVFDHMADYTIDPARILV
jgi:hypothetical protein